jgi:N-acetylglutamate synthase-like GNAT family acetyltransferase
MQLAINRQVPTDKQIDQIIDWINQTQNITGYSHGELKSFGKMYLAFESKMLVGVGINIGITKSIGELAVLIVDPNHTNSGIGKSIFELSNIDLKQEYKYSYCVTRNPIVIKMLKSAGYQQTDYWRLPLQIHLYNIKFALSIFRIKEFVTKKMYSKNLNKFEYYIRNRD